MNESKNLILAVVLSALVLLGWSFLSDRFVPANPPPKVEKGKVQAANQPSQPSNTPVAGTPSQLRDRSAVIAEAPRVQIETPSLRGSINLKGARIDDLWMLKHHVSYKKDSSPVALLSPQGTHAASFVGFSWNGPDTPNADTLWKASSPVLTPDKPVTLSWVSPTGVTYELKISIDDLYLFTVDQRVTNGSTQPIQVQPYSFSSRAGRSADVSSWTVHVGPMTVRDGKADYEADWKTIREAGPSGLKYDASKGWIGFTDKYWLTALAPEGTTQDSFRYSNTGAYQADSVGPAAIVAPGQSSNFKTSVFAGAKEKTTLDRYEAAGVPKVSKAIDWGWFEWFMRPIFDLLNWLFQITGNFGVAIILLTVIVRALMFPIAQKQFQSMAAMRKLQPKMKALQERYKEDKPRLQQEMMKLYQQEKINPAAGCLPILLQIPVFYALYKVLMVSVEMRHQPFVLWIQDLSAPDPLTPVNLFGLLDFTPPHFLAIGVLPILLGVTMWIQFKLNPAPVDPTQQQIFAIMPWVMMFVMAPFASGLQLYWVTSNILTILQQWWLYKRYGLHFSDTHPATT
ncbi:membrane protein insertase YidC [Sphingomonas daechungensis]|uniref:Membrane protein insertase YidC n=1 Tax=Sphingomonas daechungensis TaxID=1176646 RepID=A0ABX6SYR7_9SPHN|nr:membrane protein insertase YidC [Sphingomonas daechungensis]QNP42451.1 membrane protein insertase YidC [Sphingomonas daechungensis]